MKYLNNDYKIANKEKAMQLLNFAIKNRLQINLLKLDCDKEDQDIELAIFNTFLNCKNFI